MSQKRRYHVLGIAHLLPIKPQPVFRKRVTFCMFHTLPFLHRHFFVSTRERKPLVSFSLHKRVKNTLLSLYQNQKTKNRRGNLPHVASPLSYSGSYPQFGRKCRVLLPQEALFSILIGFWPGLQCFEALIAFLNPESLCSHLTWQESVTVGR